MKRMSMTGAALIALVAAAEPSGDRPDERHAWAVHDVNRPDPAKVEVAENGIPSDATVLFDGTDESVRKNWRSHDGQPSKWSVKDGTFVCVPGSGPAVTAEKFADCQLHVEWKTPVDDAEGWGNSGVIFMGAYEIQILDSSAVKPSKSPWKPANYADGQAGAVYGQNPPLVNPCRRPGEWQSFDIVFHPPVREGNRLVDPGSVTVFHNGVLVQDDFPFQGTTDWCRRARRHAEAKEGPLCLQDHGHPVPFRNVWIRRIPSRYADTVNGSVGTKFGDVAKLRHELAVQSLGFAQAADDPAEKFIRLWESYCYEPDRKVKRLIEEVEDATVKALVAGQGSFGNRERRDAFRRFVRMLVDSGWLANDAKIAVELGKTSEPR